MNEEPIVLRQSFIFWSVIFFMSHAESKNLGTHGPLFPIEEENLLDVIQRKLNAMERSGAVKKLATDLQNKMKQRAENPLVVHHLPRGAELTSRLFDPSVTIKETIKDHKGNLVVQAGRRINPLEYFSWGEPLLIFDGTDPEQVEWAIKAKGKWVLTKGSPFKLAEEHKRWVYFDQGGIIVRKFRITHLPARIIQKDKHLLIEEGMPS